MFRLLQSQLDPQHKQRTKLLEIGVYLQKNLSRKQKGSKNREKARIKVARIHAQITDSRKDHLHKLTTQLVRENQTIVVENLAVKNMVKNPKLSQAISDVSWGEITRQLAYKCRWYGRNYINNCFSEVDALLISTLFTHYRMLKLRLFLLFVQAQENL